MKLDNLVIDQEQARRKLVSYRDELRRRQDDELQAIARALEIAADGSPVISLSQAIRAGGWFENGLPRIAICRSDRPRVYVRRSDEHLTFDWHSRRGGYVRRWYDQNTVTVSAERCPPVMHSLRGETIVPIVPPDVLGRLCMGRTRLSKLFTLFEVEEWKPTPPIDPALLELIGGDLYAVLAVWDLTPLERAVLSETR